MNKLHALALRLEGVLYKFLDAQLPAVHTAWQATAGVVVAGLFTARSTGDVKALVAVAVATFLAALKHYYLSQRG